MAISAAPGAVKPVQTVKPVPKEEVKAPKEETKLPLLVGVRHMDDEKEVPKVIKVLETAKAQGAKTVALELRDDWKEQLKPVHGDAVKHTDYFVRIALAAEKLGLKVIAMDDSHLLKVSDPILTAWSYSQGGKPDFAKLEVKEKEMRQRREKTGNFAEARFCDDAIESYKAARRYMQTFTHDEIKERFDTIQAARDRIFAASISANDPDVIVVGFNHSRELKKSIGEKQYAELG